MAPSENTEMTKASRVVIIDIDGICFNPTQRLERCKDAGGKIDWDKAFSNDEVW